METDAIRQGTDSVNPKSDARKPHAGARLKGITTLWNAGWLTGSRLAGDALSLLLFIVLSRAFGAAGIGQYAYGIAIAGLVYVGVLLGIDEYGVREYARIGQERWRPFIGRLVGTQVLLATMVVPALILFVAVSRPSTETTAVILLLSAQQMCFGLARTFFIPAFARERMVLPAVGELLSRALAVVASIALVVLFDVSLAKALTPLPIGGLAFLLAGIVWARRHLGGLGVSLSWRDVATVLRIAWPFAASIVVFQVYARADVIMLSLIDGDTVTGIYASSVKAFEVGLMPLWFLGFAAFPEMSRLSHRSIAGFVDAGDRLLRFTLFAGGLLAWFLFFAAPELLAPILGSDFTAATPVLRVLAVLALLMALEVPLVRMLLAADMQVKRLKFQFLGTVINVILNLALIPLLSAIGAALSSIVAVAVTNVLYFGALQKAASLDKLTRSLGVFLLPLLAATVMGVAAHWFSPYGWLPALISLVILCSGALSLGLVAQLREVKVLRTLLR